MLTDSPVHGEKENLCFMFIQLVVCELWRFLYNAVETKLIIVVFKLIVVVFKLKEPCSLPTWISTMKALYLNGYASSW